VELKSPTFSKRVPPGDQLERLVCDECGWVHYENPKIVVGAVATHEGRYLLCRRAIEPRKGKWTIPAGFLEEHETTEQGVLREAREEACVDLEIEGLLGVYNIAKVSQVQLLYMARLAGPDFACGEESFEVRRSDTQSSMEDSLEQFGDSGAGRREDADSDETRRSDGDGQGGAAIRRARSADAPRPPPPG